VDLIFVSATLLQFWNGLSSQFFEAKLGGGFQYFFIFNPTWENDPI